MISSVQMKTLLARAVAPSLFKIYGINIFYYKKWLENTKEWSNKYREEWRLEKLNNIIDFCWQFVPFYKEYWKDHGVHKTRLNSIEELKNYPILEKKYLKNSINDFIPSNLISIPYKKDSTGGSTGEPIKYRQDLQLHSIRNAFIYYGWELAGYKFGDPVVVISGQRLLQNLQNKITIGRLRCMLERSLPLLTVHMDSDIAKQHHAKIIKFGGVYLHGYPSILSEFATQLAKEGLKLPQLKGVFTTAEMLLPQYRMNIEQKLGCPVWDSYGANDGGILSWECNRHDGLHYNDLESIIECEDREIDGNGKLLITNLWNRSFPFIRYENGDLINLDGQACLCGNHFPKLKSVVGRTADILRFYNGRSITGPALTLIFKNMPLEAWQVVQSSPTKIEVLLMSTQLVCDQNHDHIFNILKEHVGKGIEIEIRRVDKLRTTAAGKRKPIWVDIEEHFTK